MATLTLAHPSEVTSGVASSAGRIRLRDWLGSQWAVLFSNPEDFAPHPSTPEGFITLLAADFADCGVKPISLARGVDPAPSWLDFAGADGGRVVLDCANADAVVDLAERTLAAKINRLTSPFVIVLDPNARCRTTITYQARRLERARTIQDVLTVVQVLRHRPADLTGVRYDRIATG